MGHLTPQLVIATARIGVRPAIGTLSRLCLALLATALPFAVASAQPSIFIQDAVANFEGDRGSTVVNVTIGLRPKSTSTVMVILSTQDVTATGGGNRCGQPADYLSQTLVGVTFFPGDSVVNFPIPICGDAVDEIDETFAVNLSSPTNAVIGRGTALVTILDDDEFPSISVRDEAIREGDGGTSNLVFTIELSGPSGKLVSADCATTGASATGGAGCGGAVDFLDTRVSLTFQPGETTKTFTVPICGDLDKEPHETFSVDLSNLINARFGGGVTGRPGTFQPGRATGTIRNDDQGP